MTMGRLESILAEKQQEMNEDEAIRLLGWRIQLAAAALPRAMQEVSGLPQAKAVPAAAKLALWQADEVLQLLLNDALEE